MIPNNSYSASGGQSQADFYWVRLKTSVTPHEYEFLDPTNLNLTSPTIVGSPTRANALLYSLTMTADTKPAPQEDGTMDIPWDNYEDSKDFHYYLLDPFAVPPASATGNLPEWKNEKGINQSQAATSNQMLVVVVYGAKTADGIKTTIDFGSLKRTSGAHGQKSDDWSKPTIEFDGNKTEAVLSVPIGCFDSAVVTADAAIAIEKGKGFKRTYITAAVID